MADIYLFLGRHESIEDFKALESSIKHFIPELTKKEKLISIIEYGGPPYFPSRVMSYNFAFSDKKLKKYFNENKRIIQKELRYFKKHRKGLPNVTSQPFFYPMLNLVLDLNCDLILEDVIYEKYRSFVRFYHNFWRNIYFNPIPLLLAQEQNPELVSTITNDALAINFCLRDQTVLEQVNFLSINNLKTTFLIIRGKEHKDLELIFTLKGFKVISTYY